MEKQNKQTESSLSSLTAKKHACTYLLYWLGAQLERGKVNTDARAHTHTHTRMHTHTLTTQSAKTEQGKFTIATKTDTTEVVTPPQSCVDVRTFGNEVR